jgi:hypothetical protein
MTTIAEQLRAAALGPAPRGGEFGRTIGHWVCDFGRGGAAEAAHAWRNGAAFTTMSSDEQRMFLLFVACAVESETA